MDTNTTTAVWSPDTDGAWLSVPTVRDLLDTARHQREQMRDGAPAAALDVARALLRGVAANAPARPRPETRLEVPGPLMALLVSVGGPVGERAAAALVEEAGW